MVGTREKRRASLFTDIRVYRDDARQLLPWMGWEFGARATTPEVEMTGTFSSPDPAKSWDDWSQQVFVDRF
jgi:hypothetical protein